LREDSPLRDQRTMAQETADRNAALFNALLMK